MNMNDDDNIYLMHDKVVLNLKVLLEIMKNEKENNETVIDMLANTRWLFVDELNTYTCYKLVQITYMTQMLWIWIITWKS